MKNELFLYKQTENAHTVKDLLWQLSEAKQQQRYVMLEYKRVGARAYESIKVKPLGIMFSEMYFYLLAQVEESAPIAFRLDRIGECSLLAEVYTRGAKMWFLSQAEFLEVMEPADFRQEMQETISRMLGNYQKQVQLP
ncbi:MAG: WYL domain-containing protein [Anaerovibrio sp.]|nr:WYL domain-containing protein [Anaerovibrio sp.]